MKKLSLIAALTLSTMLSACGGGGSGHGYVPTTTLPSNPPVIDNPTNPGDETFTSESTNEDLTMMKTRVVADDNGFAGLVNSTLGSAYQEQTAQASTRSVRRMAAKARANDNSYMTNTNICKSERDCNQEIFDNMKKILIDQNLANASAKELRNALILAGFKDALAGMWDDVKELQKYIREHPEEVRQEAESIRDRYTTTIDHATLNLVNDNESLISFVLDDTKKIDGIKITEKSDLSEKTEETILSRQGDKNLFEAPKEKLYVYGMRIGTDCTIGACAPGAGREIVFESREKFENVEEIRKALKELLKKDYEGGFGGFHGGTNNGAFQEGDNEKLYEYALKLINDLSDDYFKKTDMDDITYDHVFYNEVDKTFKTDYQSYAKDMKLAYSDFGLLNMEGTEKFMTREKTEEFKVISVFAGGYKAKKIDPQIFAGEEMTFKGKAIGGVNFNENNNWVNNEDVKSDTLLLSSADPNNATLVFNKGQETLTAKFDNWYDIEMTTTVDSTNGNLKFTNGNKIKGTDKVDAEDFKFRGQNEYVVENFMGEQQIVAGGDKHIVVGQEAHEVTGDSFGMADIGYYGDAGIPSEATGYMVYGEEIPIVNSQGEITDDNQSRVKNLNVTLGFGLQRQ